MEERPDLLKGGVDLELWVARTDTAIARTARERMASYLCNDERSTRDSFARDSDACNYEMAHGLLRIALSFHEQRSPADWRFRKLPLGKPVLDDTFASSISFNLSHTQGLVVCALRRREHVGVDVESRAHVRTVMAVAPRQFSPDELAWLSACDPVDRESRAIELWTLKEAFVKSTGMGMHSAFHRITILPSADGCPELRAADVPPQPNTYWTFSRIRFDNEYFVAIAAATDSQRDEQRIVLRELTFPEFTIESVLLPASSEKLWCLPGNRR